MGCTGSRSLGQKASDIDFALKNTELPREFVLNMHEIFNALCPEGRMTRKQFRMIRQDQLQSDASLILFLDHMFRAFDKDSSGTIDYREFMGMLNAILCGTPSDKLDAIFCICDINENGVIEKQELVHILQGLVPFLKSGDKDPNAQRSSLATLAENMFTKFDSNADGKLTKEEFIAGCKEQPRIFEIVDTCMTLALAAPSQAKSKASDHSQH